MIFLKILIPECKSYIHIFQACDRLLVQRVEAKMKGKKVTDVLNRLHVAVPNKRDNKVECISFISNVLTKRVQFVLLNISIVACQSETDGGLVDFTVTRLIANRPLKNPDSV